MYTTKTHDSSSRLPQVSVYNTIYLYTTLQHYLPLHNAGDRDTAVEHGRQALLHAFSLPRPGEGHQRRQKLCWLDVHRSRQQAGCPQICWYHTYPLCIMYYCQLIHEWIIITTTGGRQTVTKERERGNLIILYDKKGKKKKTSDDKKSRPERRYEHTTGPCMAVFGGLLLSLCNPSSFRSPYILYVPSLNVKIYHTTRELTIQNTQKTNDRE